MTLRRLRGQVGRGNDVSAVAVDPLALYPGAVRCLGRRPGGGEGVHYRPLDSPAPLEPDDERSRSPDRYLRPSRNPVLFPGEEVYHQIASVEPVVVPSYAPDWWGDRQDRAVALLWRRWQDAVRVEVEYETREAGYAAAQKAEVERFREQAQSLGVHPGMLWFISLPTRSEEERVAASAAVEARVKNRKSLLAVRGEIAALVREMRDFEANYRPRDPDARDLDREFAEDAALREEWLADVRKRVDAMDDAEVARIVAAEVGREDDKSGSAPRDAVAKAILAGLGDRSPDAVLPRPEPEVIPLGDERDDGWG